VTALPATASGASLPTGLARVLPVVAIGVLVVVIGAILASAGSTLGFDARAYLDAGRRLVDGKVVYDTSIAQAGAAGLYYYSPPFTLLALPFSLLPEPFDVLGWLAAILAAFGLGVALLPVSRDVRWLVVLLAGLSWPFAYAVKLGQVGPILFLCFAIGWRWMDRPARLGLAMAVGTVVKLQPAILFVWAALTRRWAAIGVGLIALALAGIVASAVGGIDGWAAWLTILRSISAPIVTPHNFTPGAIAYQVGLSEAAATAVQGLNTILVLGLVLWSGLRLSPAVGYLTAVTASQLLSPVLWDHYALLLLLPTAWLLDRGQWWAVGIPLATAIFLIWLPPVIYPIAFWVALVAPIAIDLGRGVRLRAQRPGSGPVISSDV
jgi:Glycosyltransferase family 87